MFKTTTIIAVLAAFVAAQDPTAGAPACAVPCLTSNFSVSGCSDPSQTACLCQSQAYNDAVVSCVTSACSLSDQLAALTWGQATCAAAGTTLNI